MEITSSLRKLVKSLGNARHRREAGLFVAEGTKCVLDTIGHFECEYLFADKKWAEEHSTLCSQHNTGIATRADMERMTLLSTPSPVIAVYRIPEPKFRIEDLTDTLVIALDRVQDPGNLGTIIRVADWMGVRNILASADTADVWNPKVVQATMGSIARVSIHYTELPRALETLKAGGTDIYGTFLEGDDIYGAELSESGVIVMGNEGSGISEAVGQSVTRKLYIPPYPRGAETAESLNVAIATAITLSEFRRRQG